MCECVHIIFLVALFALVSRGRLASGTISVDSSPEWIGLFIWPDHRPSFIYKGIGNVELQNTAETCSGRGELTGEDVSVTTFIASHSA